MTTPCCWPFCGADPKECDCADNVKKEVMQPERPIDQHAVAPPPVSEAGGDLPTNDEKTNMTDETCKENAEKLTVALPEPSCYYEGTPTAPLWEYKKMITYGDERCARETAALLGLIADIRKAAGDPTGKLMQAELVELISKTRAERDALAEKVKYWRQRAKSAEGHLPKSDMDAAAKAVHMRSNLSGTPWAELRRDQQIACQIAASAAVRAINASRDARKPKDAAIAAGGGDD